MVGEDGNDRITGGLGTDMLRGGIGRDGMWGGGGNDTINGGDGNDVIFGDTDSFSVNNNPGRDIIRGGLGDDKLFQNQDPIFANPLTSDGFKDSLNCGPGDDIAYINRTIDHDRAINCEHINPTH